MVFIDSDDSDNASNRSSPLRQVVSRLVPEVDILPPISSSYHRVLSPAELSDEDSPHRSRRARKRPRGNQGDVNLLSHLGPNYPEVATAAINSPIRSISTLDDSRDFDDGMSTGQSAEDLGDPQAQPFGFARDEHRHRQSHPSYSSRPHTAIDFPEPYFPRPLHQDSSSKLSSQYRRPSPDIYPYSPDGRDPRYHLPPATTRYEQDPRRSEFDRRFARTKSHSLSDSRHHHSAANALISLGQQSVVNSSNPFHLENRAPPRASTLPHTNHLQSEHQYHSYASAQRSPEVLLPDYRPDPPETWHTDRAPPTTGRSLPPVSHVFEAAGARHYNRPRNSSYSSVQSLPSMRHDPFARSRSPNRNIAKLLNSPIQSSQREPTPPDTGSRFSPVSAKSAPVNVPSNPQLLSPRSAVAPLLRGSITSASSFGAGTDSSSLDNAYTPITEVSSSDYPLGVDVISNAKSMGARQPRQSPIRTLSAFNSSSQPGASGGFRCTFEGCNAAPFSTQYLLNSHANVHSSERPHFCPVADCPRGIGGTGFKRKNEMIRHGLVHNSPGYVCPFCPDREHRYPRPDNLQRHVRQHHKDRSADDHRLRSVLAQRPVGGRPRGTVRLRRPGNEYRAGTEEASP